MMKVTDIQKFNEAVVVPYAELLERPSGKSIHKGGVIWDDWENAGLCRHHRSGKPVDDCPDWPATDLEVVSGNSAWCGAVVNHFGHQIADFSTRIAMYRDADTVYYFSKKAGLIPPAFFWDVLDWLRVTKDQVRVIDKPVVLKSLQVAPQQEQLGVGSLGPGNHYLQIMNGIMEANGLEQVKKAGALYVSRAGLSTGLIAGERYLESLLAGQGVKVMRPEKISLRDQLQAYVSHETLIFAEGSALHGLQLLGDGLGVIHVLNRRPKQKMIQGLLGPRAAELHYHDVGNIVCPLSLSGRKALFKGITVPSFSQITSLLQQLGVSVASAEKSIFERAVEKDVQQWLEREVIANSKGVRSDSKALVLQELAKLGYQV